MCQPRYLLPRVIGAAREHFRCMQVCLRVNGLPRCARGPFTLMGIEAAEEEARVRAASECCARGAEVVVPLNVWVCDGCGERHCGTAELCLRVRMPSGGGGCGAQRGSLVAQACVRLIEGACAQCEPAFDVRVEAWADIFRVRMEPCGRIAPPEKPPCPQLPMYPQPPICPEKPMCPEINW